MKYATLFYGLLILSSCISRNEKQLPILQKYFADKNADSLVMSAINIGQVDKPKDSLIAYLSLCQTITDSLNAWQKYKATAALALYLTSLESRASMDSLAKEKFISIIYTAAIANYTFDYNDTVVTLLETALHNTNDSIKLINCVNSLCTEYNILGDKNKTIHYFDIGYSLLSDLLKTNKKISYKKKANTFASHINNRLVFFNEYHLYDSTIKYASIGLQLDSLQPQRIAYLKSNLAEALYYSGKKQEAIPLLDVSLDLLYKEDTTNKDIRNRISSVLNVKAALLREEKQYAKSNEYLMQSFAMINYDFFNRYTGKTLLALAGNFLDMGQTDSTLQYAHEALRTVTKVDSGNIFSLPLLSKRYAENTIEACADTLASAFIMKYTETGLLQYANAVLRCFDLAFAVENKLLVNYTYDDSKIALLDESRKRSERAIAFCYSLFQNSNDKLWAQKAFEYSEGNKAIVLLQSLKKNIAANSLLQRDSVYKRLQNLQLKTSFLEKNIVLAELERDASSIQLKKEKEKTDNELLQASSLLLKDNPAYKSLLQSSDTINIQAIVHQVLKKNDEALLEFFSGATGIYTFIFSNDGNMLFSKYDSSVLHSVHSYLSFFAKEDSIATNPKAFQHEAFSLFNQLDLAQITSAYHKLIIIPDGIFSALPFESLLYKQSNSVLLKSLPYFIKICNISYAFSAATLLKQREQSTNTSHTMLAMAPVFSNSKFAALPGTIDELAAIKKQMPDGHYFLNNDASLSNFRSYCNTVSFIHLATHAFANSTAAVPEIEFTDSSITLHEIYATPMQANLAVLSACNTGIGRLQTGEGFISLARGFYYAGVPHVITSLWQVNDAATHHLFETFYASIKKYSLENAFYQSKIKWLNSNQSDDKYSPYYWAGFIFIGDDTSVPSDLSYWWWLLLPVGVLLLYVLKRVNNKKVAGL